MSATSLTRTNASERQLTSFYLGETLLAIDIHHVQEINRQFDITSVPHAPDRVRGVLNLRGDVVTAIDLRRILGLPACQLTPATRNLIVHHQGELVGLLVDRISDILAVSQDQLLPPPSNVSDVDGRFIESVYTLDDDIVAILNVDEILSDNSQ
ncbi:MAG: chemotaxis protein CheW [Pirellulaceae bacterium]